MSVDMLPGCLKKETYSLCMCGESIGLAACDLSSDGGS